MSPRRAVHLTAIAAAIAAAAAIAWQAHGAQQRVEAQAQIHAARLATVAAAAAQAAHGAPRALSIALGERAAALSAEDAAKLAEATRLFGVDGLIDGVLAAEAADSLWVLDAQGAVAAQGALVAQAGGAFADPDPAAAALARAALADGKPKMMMDYVGGAGRGVDGVFAAAAMFDRHGERVGATLLRLPLEGRREAERDAAKVAAIAAAGILLFGGILGRLT